MNAFFMQAREIPSCVAALMILLICRWADSPTQSAKRNTRQSFCHKLVTFWVSYSIKVDLKGNYLIISDSYMCTFTFRGKSRLTLTIDVVNGVVTLGVGC